MIRIAVTGGRHYGKASYVEAILDEARKVFPRFILVHGDCPTGADRFAQNWTKRGGGSGKIFECRCPADWNDPFFRKSINLAGHARNEEMIREFVPELVLAFRGGNGTAHCVGVARRRGIFVIDLADEPSIEDFRRQLDEWVRAGSEGRGG